MVKLYLAGGSAAAGERATIGLEIWLFRTGIGTFTPAKSIETVSDWLIYSDIDLYHAISRLLYYCTEFSLPSIRWIKLIVCGNVGEIVFSTNALGL